MTAYSDKYRERVAAAIGTYYANNDIGTLADTQRADDARATRKAARYATGKLSEHEHQVLVVQWLKSRGHSLFSVPNGAILGGTNKYAQLGKLRSEGMSRGVPDLVISPPKGNRVTTALEMKSPGGTVSPEQKAWLDELERWGWRVLVAYGHEQAISRLMEAGS